MLACVTFSIVARDSESRELGVAVSTAMFAAGPVVPWCRPGVGAVASQAIADPAYGPRCLDALASGSDAGAALAAAQELDPAAPLRQVAVVGSDGSVAVDTGALCIDHAGHQVGAGFTVQANMVASDDVWPAMADAYTRSTGALARRLHAALVAGADAGGDARGACSAALVVVTGDPAPSPGAGIVVDVRVDLHADPVAELARLLDAADAYAGFAVGVDQLTAGDATAALSTLDSALSLVPGDENLRFVRAGALAADGDVAGARAELRALVAARPSWEIVVRSFAAKGLLALPAGITVDALFDGGAGGQDAG
jgi:uncharacterized Ntn-hydrolase superfamily protein